MATDAELQAYQDRATALQNAVRNLVRDIMEDVSLPAQSFDDPINRHNLTQQAVGCMNQLEMLKQPIQRKFDEKARAEAEIAAAEAAAEKKAADELLTPP